MNLRVGRLFQLVFASLFTAGLAILGAQSGQSLPALAQSAAPSHPAFEFAGGDSAAPDIVGGEPIGHLETDYPSAGYYFTGRRMGQFVMATGAERCSAVVVAPRRVLTAAHCSCNMHVPDNADVFFAQKSVQAWGMVAWLPNEVYLVDNSASQSHPCHICGGHQVVADLAYLTLADQQDDFGDPDTLEPASTGAIDQLGPHFRIAGYGATAYGGSDFGKRRELDWIVDLVWDGSIHGVPPQTGTGPWSGDSGGPLYDRGSGRVLGIASTGSPTGEGATHEAVSGHRGFLNLPGELCGNGQDDDGDGLVDSIDPDCSVPSGGIQQCYDDDLFVGTPYSSTTTGRGNRIAPPACAPTGGDDALLRWTVATSAVYRIDLDALAPFDATLLVLDGCGGTVLECASTGAGGSTSIDLYAYQGQELIVAVDSDEVGHPDLPNADDPLACSAFLPLPSGGLFTLSLEELTGCEPMDVSFSGEGCPGQPTLGWFWDGCGCQPFEDTCACVGEDCDDFFNTQSECQLAYQGCPSCW